MSRAPTSPLELRWIKIDRALADGLEPLALAHYNEVDPHAARFPFKVDWSLRRMLERTANYRALAAYRDARLIGYAGFFVQPMQHSCDHLCAFNDGIYVAPNERKGNAGLKIVAEAQTHLPTLGIEEIVYGVNLPGSEAGVRLSRFFDQCGYPPVEMRHRKVL